MPATLNTIDQKLNQIKWREERNNNNKKKVSGLTEFLLSKK